MLLEGFFLFIVPKSILNVTHLGLHFISMPLKKEVPEGNEPRKYVNFIPHHPQDKESKWYPLKFNRKFCGLLAAGV